MATMYWHIATRRIGAAPGWDIGLQAMPRGEAEMRAAAFNGLYPAYEHRAVFVPGEEPNRRSRDLRQCWSEALREQWQRDRVRRAGYSWSTHFAKMDGTVVKRSARTGGTRLEVPPRSPELGKR